MEQRLVELKEERTEEVEEYLQFIRSSVEDGTFFKDALNWYFFRYITPVCDKAYLIIGGILSLSVAFMIYQMINNAFPLVEKVPIIIAAEDSATYYSHLINLKPKVEKAGYDPGITTADEAVAKYLASVYVKNRESYDFSNSEISEVNRQLNWVRNTSSANEYKAFQRIMDKENPNSPIHQFGNNITRSVEIESVTIIKKKPPKDLFSQAKLFISAPIPNTIEVRFTTTTTTKLIEGEKKDKERLLARINFDFDGVNHNSKGEIRFVVRSYKLLRRT